jgi:hypothetical protein
MVVAPIDGGTTVPSVGGSPHTVEIGVPVSIVATPADGKVFTGWTASANAAIVNAAAASTTVTLSAAATVTANFADDIVATVVSAKVFYNNSAWDGNSAAANVSDDTAVATDKSALLPGGAATFANYTSFSKGLNGIMVDIANLAGTPTAADFSFKAGNDNTPATWSDAAAPTTVATRSIGGGITRVTLIWADNVIAKTWLQVTVKATPQTGLATLYVFYLGNAIGESGNSVTDALVNASDQLGARNNPKSLGSAPVTDRYDYNRDKNVNSSDQLISRGNATSVLTAIKLISPE